MPFAFSRAFPFSFLSLSFVFLSFLSVSLTWRFPSLSLSLSCLVTRCWKRKGGNPFRLFFCLFLFYSVCVSFYIFFLFFHVTLLFFNQCADLLVFSLFLFTRSRNECFRDFGRWMECVLSWLTREMFDEMWCDMMLRDLVCNF